MDRLVQPSKEEAIVWMKKIVPTAQAAVGLLVSGALVVGLGGVATATTDLEQSGQSGAVEETTSEPSLEPVGSDETPEPEQVAPATASEAPVVSEESATPRARMAAASLPDTYEQEPNDSSSQANGLTLGQKIRATAYRSSSSSDSDWYTVYVPQDGRLTVDLQFPAGLGIGNSYDIELNDEQGNTLQSFELDLGDASGSWLRSQAIFVGAGRYYIEVYAGKYRTTWGKEYSLKVTNTAGTVEHEPNNYSASADSLQVGKVIKGSSLRNSRDDSDWYAINIPKSGRYTLDMRFPSGLGNGNAYSVSIDNAHGDELYSYDLSLGDASGYWLRSQVIQLSVGWNYIEVYGNEYRETWGKEYMLALYSAFSSTPMPKIKGKAFVGSTLTASVASWAPAPDKYAYQWLRNGVAISGATSITYKLTNADHGKQISFRVTGTKSTYSTVAKMSTATGTVQWGLKSATPKITGKAKVGKTLKVGRGSWTSGTKFSYQWYANGKAIKGATKSSYKVTKSQKGKKITVKVTGSKSGYNKVSKTSKATSKVK